MIRSGLSNDKRILLIDKAPKTTNDRTWCFWEQEPGFFEPLVFHRWSDLNFFSDTYTARLDIDPYEYKMIRAVDFYQYCFAEIEKHSNIEIIYGNIARLEWKAGELELRIDDSEHSYLCPLVFNSMPQPPTGNKRVTRLLQHFKGWLIDTDRIVFDKGKATLMDFRIPQEHGTAFVYVLPFSDSRALVEYTLFTDKLLEPGQYDAALSDYITNYLKVDHFTVAEEEFGVIPMTNEHFPFQRNGIFQIGTAGGQTKPSTGYTFQFIQKQSVQIVDRLMTGRDLSGMHRTPRRFRFYDNTLLHILYHKKIPGRQVFTQLFKKNKPQRVLRFLDNESSLTDELRIISTLPTWPFLLAAMRH